MVVDLGEHDTNFQVRVSRRGGPVSSHSLDDHPSNVVSGILRALLANSLNVVLISLSFLPDMGHTLIDLRD